MSVETNNRKSWACIFHVYSLSFSFPSNLFLPYFIKFSIIHWKFSKYGPFILEMTLKG